MRCGFFSARHLKKMAFGKNCVKFSQTNVFRFQEPNSGHIGLGRSSEYETDNQEHCHHCQVVTVSEVKLYFTVVFGGLAVLLFEKNKSLHCVCVTTSRAFFCMD